MERNIAVNSDRLRDISSQILESGEMNHESEEYFNKIKISEKLLETTLKENFYLEPIDNIYYQKRFNSDDLRDKSKIAKQFICNICRFLFKDPMMCNVCGNLICKECYNTWKIASNNSVCPYCKSYFPGNESMVCINRLLSEIEIKCPLDESCGEDIQIESYTRHIEECKALKRKAKCKNCDITIATNNKKDGLLEHMKICQNRMSICRYCKLAIRLIQKLRHEENCDRKIVHCEQCLSDFENKIYKNHKYDDNFLCLTIKNLKEEIKEKNSEIAKQKDIISRLNEKLKESSEQFEEINKKLLRSEQEKIHYNSDLHQGFSLEGQEQINSNSNLDQELDVEKFKNYEKSIFYLILIYIYYISEIIFSPYPMA